MKKGFKYINENKRKRKSIHLISILFLSVILFSFLVVLNEERFRFIEIPSNLTLQSGISNRHFRTEGNTINGNVYTGKVISDLFGELPSSSANINFSSEIGIVRDDFYGANVHNFLTNGQKVDADADGVSETISDLSWNRQAWLDSQMRYMRWDMSLGSYYFYDSFNNLDFENWTNTNVGFFDSSAETGAVGWKISTYGGSSGFVSQSTEAHSGSYSLNVSSNKSSHVYVYRSLGFKEGNNYNFSVWVKPNGTISVLIQKLNNYQSCGWVSVTGDGSEWKFASVYCPNAEETGYRLVIDAVNEGESVLIDDVNLTENSQEYSPIYFFSGSLLSKNERLKWAHENNIRTLIIADYMPPWLSDVNREGCNKSKLTDCMPYDMEIWKNITLDYLDRVTENGFYAGDIDLEVWNEPYGGFFLSELPFDSSNKSIYYNELYNATYFAVKSKYPKIAVGGPSGFYNAPNMLKGFLSNFSQQMDFVSVHPYIDKYESNTNGMYNKTKWVFNLCSIYNANCSRIINSEWNIANVLIKNSSENNNRFGENIALAYADMLNNYPENISMMLYQWSENKKYLPNVNYSEYPQRWSMVSEPGLDNEYYPSFNVTKNFATYHSAGSIIVRSNSSSNNIKVVASKREDSQFITVINAEADNNVNLNIFENASSGIKDLETGEIYNLKNGLVDIGLVSQYQIRYFVNVEVPIPVVNPISQDSGSTGGGSSKVTSKVVYDIYFNESNESIKINKEEETKENENKGGSPNLENNTKDVNPGKTFGSGFAILENGKNNIFLVGTLLISIIFLGFIVLIVRKVKINRQIEKRRILFSESLNSLR